MTRPVSGNTVTIKSDAGATTQVTVSDDAKLLRIEPGQKTLAGASPFSLVDLQAGDRVMARGAAGPEGSSLTASMLVAIKGADIAQKQAHEREDWQKNGTGGLVKSVDAAAGTVTRVLRSPDHGNAAGKPGRPPAVVRCRVDLGPATRLIAPRGEPESQS